jgi:pentatricopeptide repeat protein
METKGTEIMQVNDPESIIRFAIEKGNVDVGTMERLLVMRKELQAEFAKKQFDEALAAFQSECPAVEKKKKVMNKDGRSVRYCYAPLDDIVEQVKPSLKAHGFSYSLDTKVDLGWVEAMCEITHSAGHSKTKSFKCPIDKDGYMNEPQKYASALTFAKRYAFCNAFGILTADEDTDSITTKDKPSGPSKLKVDDTSLEPYARQLWNILISVRGLAKNWDKANEWLREMEFINDTEELPYTLSIDRYKEVIDKSNNFLKTNPLGVKK